MMTVGCGGATRVFRTKHDVDPSRETLFVSFPWTYS